MSGFNQKWSPYAGSIPVRPQVVVVPLPGAGNNPRAEPREHSDSGVDTKGHVVCKEFYSNKNFD